MSHFILRLLDVKKRTGLSRSSIYLRMANNEFPKSVSLGGRAIGWVEQDIEEWINERIEASRSNHRG